MFRDTWWCQRWWHLGQRRHIWTVVYFLLCLAIGCRHVSDREWQSRYDDTRKKLWYGYYAQAFQQAKENYREASPQSETWSRRFQALEAQSLLFQGKPKEALDLLKGDDSAALPPDVRARKRFVQADALCRLGKEPVAEPLLAETETLISQESTLRAELALARGRCALSTDRTTALKDFTSAYNLAHGRDEFVEATGFLNAGFVLLGEERYSESIDRFLEGVQVTNSPLLQEKLRGNLGFVYSQLADWKKAISFSEPAERLAKEIGNLGDQERWLNDLGRAHFALWDLQESETYYAQALAIGQQLDDRAASAACFNNLTRLELRKRDLDKAEAFLKQGEGLGVEAEKLHFSVDAAEIALAQKRLSEAGKSFRFLVSRTGRDKVLQSMIQRDLGRVYSEQGKVARADRMFRGGIKTAENAVAELKRPEYRMSFMDQDPFYDSYIQFLVAQHKPIDALRIAEQSRAQLLAAALGTGKSHDPVISAAELQALAKRRQQVVLAYSMTDEKTFLWVITSSQFKLFELPGHDEISSQIDDFNREIQDHRNLEDSPGGQRLYQALIQPAEKFIPPQSSVAIIPSKLLSLVNFETLIVPGPKPHYWIDEVDVGVAGSLALLAAPKSTATRKVGEMRDLLLLGAPIEASKDFPVLKNAPEEIKLIQTHFPAEEATVISGKAATPQAYRNGNPGEYRFLHFDAHGVASDLSPLDSAIVLSPGGDSSYKLYAREIKDIPLHAELVTISACSGSGTRWYQGEGLVGLAWAFMRAGAHQVVGALWEMDEASSPQLMDHFYGELTQGKSAAESLRDAKLKMLHSNTFYRHPYYWASLQLYTGS
ncbi:MAG TPA: CHAT domain-containing tetratricopeptide repeat protein [Terriglobales bacterium]